MCLQWMIAALPYAVHSHTWHRRKSEAHRRLHGRATLHFFQLRRTLPRFSVAVAVITRFYDVEGHRDRPCLGHHLCCWDNGALPEVASVVTPGWIAASWWQHVFPIEGDGGQLFARARHIVSQNLGLHRVLNPWDDLKRPFDDFFVSVCLRLAVLPWFVNYLDDYSARVYRLVCGVCVQSLQLNMWWVHSRRWLYS